MVQLLVMEAKRLNLEDRSLGTGAFDYHLQLD